MSMHTPCQPRRLAAQGSIRIDLCSCGQVHVSIGPTTVRLAQPVARALGDALATAMAHLEHPVSPPLPLQ